MKMLTRHLQNERAKARASLPVMRDFFQQTFRRILDILDVQMLK